MILSWKLGEVHLGMESLKRWPFFKEFESCSHAIFFSLEVGLQPHRRLVYMPHMAKP